MDDLFNFEFEVIDEGNKIVVDHGLSNHFNSLITNEMLDSKAKPKQNHRKVTTMIDSPTTAAFIAKPRINNAYSYVSVSDSDNDNNESSSDEYNYNQLANDEDMNLYIQEQKTKMMSKNEKYRKNSNDSSGENENENENESSVSDNDTDTNDYYPQSKPKFENTASQQIKQSTLDLYQKNLILTKKLREREKEDQRLLKILRLRQQFEQLQTENENLTNILTQQQKDRAKNQKKHKKEKKLQYYKSIEKRRRKSIMSKQHLTSLMNETSNNNNSSNGHSSSDHGRNVSSFFRYNITNSSHNSPLAANGSNDKNKFNNHSGSDLLSPLTPLSATGTTPTTLNGIGNIEMQQEERIELTSDTPMAPTLANFNNTIMINTPSISVLSEQDIDELFSGPRLMAPIAYSAVNYSKPDNNRVNRHNSNNNNGKKGNNKNGMILLSSTSSFTNTNNKNDNTGLSFMYSDHPHGIASEINDFINNFINNRQICVGLPMLQYKCELLVFGYLRQHCGVNSKFAKLMCNCEYIENGSIDIDNQCLIIPNKKEFVNNSKNIKEIFVVPNHLGFLCLQYYLETNVYAIGRCLRLNEFGLKKLKNNNKLFKKCTKLSSVSSSVETTSSNNNHNNNTHKKVQITGFNDNNYATDWADSYRECIISENIDKIYKQDQNMVYISNNKKTMHCFGRLSTTEHIPSISNFYNSMIKNGMATIDNKNKNIRSSKGFTDIETVKVSGIRCVSHGWGRHLIVCLEPSGILYCHGNNMYGECGIGYNKHIPFVNTTTVLQVFRQAKIENIISISTGRYHTLFLSSYGMVYGCGNNEFGQLGLGNKKIIESIPCWIRSFKNIKIIEIECSKYGSFALDECGIIYFTGFLQNGQFSKDIDDLKMEYSDGYDTDKSNNKIASTTAKNRNKRKDSDNTKLECLYHWKVIDYFVENEIFIKKIKTGCDHCVALSENGEIYTWGNNWYATIGNGTYFDKYIFNTPVKINVMDNDSGLNKNNEKEIVTDIECGYQHNIVVTKKNNVYTWGNNQNYQCCVEKLKSSNDKHNGNLVTIPTKINESKMANGIIASVTAGYSNTLFIMQ